MAGSTKKATARLTLSPAAPGWAYILDFYCSAARLAVEVDGLAHDTAAQACRDERRQAWLAQQKIRVIRIRARDVLRDEELERVLLAIERAAAPSGSLALATSPA